MLLQSTTPHKIGHDIYMLLPSKYRRKDHSPLLCSGETDVLKYCERFCRIFGDTLDSVRNEYAKLLNYWNPRRCDADILEYLALNYGWNLDVSLDEDFQRILVENIWLIYNLAGRKRAIWYLIYAHTGITVDVIRVNDENAAIANHHTYPTAAYCGEDYIDVADIGCISAKDRIWACYGQQISSAEVSSIFSNRIYLSRPFSYHYPAGLDTTIIHNSADLNGLAGVGGQNLCIADVTPCGFGIAGHEYAELMPEVDRIKLLTLTVRFPWEPTAAQKAIARAILDYVLPARAHYTFVYGDSSEYIFYADHSRVDSRDVVSDS